MDSDTVLTALKAFQRTRTHQTSPDIVHACPKPFLIKGKILDPMEAGIINLVKIYEDNKFNCFRYMKPSAVAGGAVVGDLEEHQDEEMEADN